MEPDKTELKVFDIRVDKRELQDGDRYVTLTKSMQTKNIKERQTMRVKLSDFQKELETLNEKIQEMKEINEKDEEESRRTMQTQ